jgi:hypothetical protein
MKKNLGIKLKETICQKRVESRQTNSINLPTYMNARISMIGYLARLGQTPLLFSDKDIYIVVLCS